MDWGSGEPPDSAPHEGEEHEDQHREPIVIAFMSLMKNK